MSARRVISVLIAGATLGATAVLSAPVSSTTVPNVLTFGYSISRTQHDTVDANVTKVSALPSWDAHLDGSVYGEPLLYRQQVIVGTENNTLYSLSPLTGKRIWSVHLGAPVHLQTIWQDSGLDGCGDINPLGITGTPAISGTGVAYVAYESFNGAQAWYNIRHYLAAVNLVTRKILWHRIIDPAGGNRPGGYQIPAEQQRPAATLVGGRVYVNFGGLAGDCGTYHGYVVSLPGSGIGAEAVYQVPSQTEGAIWDLGGAAVAGNGDLVVATGNGASTSTFDGGDAVVELTPALKAVGVWAPPNWADLTANDWDLGSGGVLPVPGTNYLFVAGKRSTIPAAGFLLKLGAIGHGPSAAPFTAQVCDDSDPGVFGADASAPVVVAGKPVTYVFVPCQHGTEAIAIGGTSTSPTFTRVWAPSSGAPAGSPIVAGGVVWSLSWDSQSLYGMSPSTGVVLFDRPTDSLPHFATPLLAGGKLLIPTTSGVEAYSVS